MERIIDKYSIYTDPRDVLAAIDRWATKKGYSVYEDSHDQLRVYGRYTKFRIKNDAGKLEVLADGAIPKMWFLLPVVILGTGIAFQDVLACVVALVLAYFAIDWMKKRVARLTVKEAASFSEKLTAVITQTT